MDDTRKVLLRSWLTKAASDLRGARILGAADEPSSIPPSIIASKRRKRDHEDH